MKRHLIAALLMSASLPMFPAIANATDAKPAVEAPHHGPKGERHQKWKNATPEERAKFKAEHEARWKEKYAKATPEEKKRMDARKAHHDAMKDKWDKATPAEREKMKADHQARIKEHQAKWDAATPEQREKMRAEWKAKHGNAPTPPAK